MNKIFKTFCCVVGIVILLISCEKDANLSQTENLTFNQETVTEQSIKVANFLTKGYIEIENKHVVDHSSSRSYDPHIDYIIDDLFAKDAQSPFIDALVDTYGYPSWKFAIVPDEMGGTLAITGLMKTTDNFLSAVMTSAIREDGSVEYGLYSREDILSPDYDFSLKNLISVTHNALLAQTIFNDIDCEISTKLFEEIEDQIEEDGLKALNLSGTRDCLEVTVYMQQCTDYYSVAGDGTATYLYTYCDTWTETYTTGCNGTTPGANNTSGSTINTNNDDNSNGGPRPDPIEDGGDDNNNDDNNNNENNDARTAIETLCDTYPTKCDCLLTADNESDAKLVHRLITDHGDLLDPCNQGSSFIENILSSVCAKNGGNLTSATLLEEINGGMSDGLIDAYNDLVDIYSSGCHGLNDLNEIIGNLADCNLTSFTSEFNLYYGIISEPSQQVVLPTLTIGSQLCAGVFDIQSVGDNIHDVGAISGLRFDVINSAGATLTVNIDHLVIHIDSNIEHANCPGSSTANLMTQAVNETIALVRARMGNVQNYEDLTSPNTFHDILNNILGQKSGACVGHGLGGSAEGYSTNNPLAETASCNASFTQFNNNHISNNNGSDCQ